MEAEILGKISREKLLSLLESQLSEKRTNHILGVEREWRFDWQQNWEKML